MFIFLFTLPVLRFAVASNAAGENPQNSVRAREIRRNNRVRLTLAARRLVLVMAKNSVYASYTSAKALRSNIPAILAFNTEYARLIPLSLALYCYFHQTHWSNGASETNGGNRALYTRALSPLQQYLFLFAVTL